MQAAASKEALLTEEARSMEQQLARQARRVDKVAKEAEARMQVALAAKEAAHGNDLNLLEGGLLQRLKVWLGLPTCMPALDAQKRTI